MAADVKSAQLAGRGGLAAGSRLGYRTLWRDALNTLLRDRLAAFGLVLVLIFLVLALLGPLVTPYDHLRQDFAAIAKGPTAAHWLGTDELGRDMFSRIVMGMRTGLLVALVVTSIQVILGTLLGAIAGFFGGWVDSVISQLINGIIAFPYLLLALFVSATVRPPIQVFFQGLYERTQWPAFRSTLMLDYLVVIGALGFVAWPGLARLVRGQILSLRERDYILAARTVGATGWHVITRHLIPNALGPVIVATALNFGGAILLEASLSYLGIGIMPPGASLGRMINENLSAWRFRPHLVLVPASVLALILLGFTILGDGLNDALDPRRRRR
jgi:ABC-type dipeptide/oligopeptide/nickel transport system permease subunit